MIPLPQKVPVREESISGDPGPASSQHSSMEEDLDLGRYLRLVRRHWLVLVSGAAVGALAGVTAASLRPVLYQAATTILIGRSDSVVASATSRALLENHTLAAQTLQEVGVDITPQAFITNVLVVEQVPGTNIMRVKVALQDASKAAQASRVLSQKAVELNRRIASEEGSAVRGQLKTLLEQSAERLTAAEAQFVRYEDVAQIELLKKDTDRMIAERGELLRLRIDIETEKARLGAAEQEIKKHDRVLAAPRAVAAEAALRRAGRPLAADPTERLLAQLSNQTEAFTRAADEPLPGPRATNRQSPQPQSRTKTREAREAMEEKEELNAALEKRFAGQAAALDAGQEALRRLAPTNSGEVDAELLDLSHPLMNPVHQTLSFQIAMSRTRLAAMERQQREMVVVGKLGSNRYPQLSTLYQRTGELARLENNLALARKVYADLTVRYEQSRAESVDTMVQLQVVDEAITPDRPLARKRLAAAALGATAGLVFAGILALAWGTRPGRPGE